MEEKRPPVPPKDVDRVGRSSIVPGPSPDSIKATATGSIHSSHLSQSTVSSQNTTGTQVHHKNVALDAFNGIDPDGFCHQKDTDPLVDSNTNDRMSSTTVGNATVGSGTTQTAVTMRVVTKDTTGYNAGQYVTRLGSAQEEGLIQEAIAKARCNQLPWYKRIFSSR